ncbi:uncharacterized protein STAUR_2020 [Stigmatella aurantiaca DW4/3-1]|uniref:Uncharacterized protein n=2 Tax=Stigmatella aurantiaca TaxID=41 RepID=Q08WH9_STIAD|nr:uncharacterized protein STAUR_2020 [Stigmatella aurantiaca DW4/3-1]EAU64854.1 hypothetical protein STIAU_2341 [Stigmatella aurantiaca DW4/3-1]
MKTLQSVMGGLLAMGAATAAWAGQRVTYLVGVDTSAREAYGAIGAAHNSDDPIQFIGCSVYTFANGAPFMYCGARNESGSIGACQSSDPIFLDAARNVKESSYIYFTWDDLGKCTYVLVNNSSYYVPKVAP